MALDTREPKNTSRPALNTTEPHTEPAYSLFRISQSLLLFSWMKAPELFGEIFHIEREIFLNQYTWYQVESDNSSRSPWASQKKQAQWLQVVLFNHISDLPSGVLLHQGVLLKMPGGSVCRQLYTLTQIYSTKKQKRSFVLRRQIRNLILL